MWTDPIVEEIRKYRFEHAKKFNFDVFEIAKDIKKREKDTLKKRKKSESVKVLKAK